MDRPQEWKNDVAIIQNVAWFAGRTPRYNVIFFCDYAQSDKRADAKSNET
jgi:hypothetical protein